MHEIDNIRFGMNEIRIELSTSSPAFHEILESFKGEKSNDPH